MSNDQSHLGFFANKRARAIVVADEGEDPQYLADIAARHRQSVRRGSILPEVVMDSLVHRAKDPTAIKVMRIKFDEWNKIRKDPDFQPFADYAPALLYYCGPDGRPDTNRPRERSVRPLVENEVGMYKERIVVLVNMPGEANRGETAYVQVKEDIGVRAEPEAPVEVTRHLEGEIENIHAELHTEPDPFPDPQKTIDVSNAAIAEATRTLREAPIERFDPKKHLSGVSLGVDIGVGKPSAAEVTVAGGKIKMIKGGK